MSKDTHRYYEVTVEFDRKRYKTGQIDIGNERDFVIWATDTDHACQIAVELVKMAEGKQLINSEDMKAKAKVSKIQIRK